MTQRSPTSIGLLVLAGALAASACTSLLGTFELVGGGSGGATGSGGGGGASASSAATTGDASASSAGGASASGVSSTSTGAVEGAWVLAATPPVDSGPASPPRANSVAIGHHNGAMAIGGEFDTNLLINGQPYPCAGSRCGFVAGFDVKGSWQWSLPLTMSDVADHAIVRGVVYDPNSLKDTDVFVTGDFVGQLNLGGNCPSITSSNTPQIFVAKLSSGGCTWLTSSSANTDSRGTSLTVDPMGNLYLGGDFNGTLLLPGDPSGGINSGADRAGFVAMLDGSGSCHWDVPVLGVASEVTAITTAAATAVMITGSFKTGMQIGPSCSITTPSMDATTADLFTARLDPTNGNCSWLMGAGAMSGAAGNGIAVSGGKIAVTGTFAGGVTFNNVGACTVNAVGASSSLVAKLSPTTGKCVWASAYSGTSVGIVADGSNSFRLAGNFTGTTTLGTSTLTAPGMGQSAAFVANLADTNAFSWLEGLVGEGLGATALAGRPGTGETAVVGNLDGSAAFGKFPLIAAHGLFFTLLGP